MDEPQTLTPPASPVRRRRVFRLGLVMVVGLLAIVVFCSLISSDTDKIIWYSPDEILHPEKPGHLVEMKMRILQWSEPVLHHFNKTKVIEVDSHILVLPAMAAESANLGPPASTNASGLRLWILPSAKLEVLTGKFIFSPIRDGFRPAREQDLVHGPDDAPSAGVADGFPELQVNEGARASVGASYRLLRSGEKRTFNIMSVVNPRISTDSLRLTFCVISTNALITSDGSETLVTTNFFAACRAVVPNGDDVVIDAGKGMITNHNHWWIILSPRRLNLPVK